MSTRQTGALGETIALKHLKKQGYKVLDTNFATRFGEIDIIAEDKKDITFIEVKFRRTKEFGTPAEAVDARKQARIIKSALEYVKSKGLTGRNLRFDVLAVGPAPENIELIKNAFMSSGRYTL